MTKEELQKKDELYQQLRTMDPGPERNGVLREFWGSPENSRRFVAAFLKANSGKRASEIVGIDDPVAALDFDMACAILAGSGGKWWYN